MSKCTEIRDFLGDYAFEVEYSENNKFTMFFNSMRNAKTVKRCIELDDSVPNVATAVDFVEVIRCRDCKYWDKDNIKQHTYSSEDSTPADFAECTRFSNWFVCQLLRFNDYCSLAERRENNEN